MKNNYNPLIIVSMTSWKNRIQYVSQAIKSIKEQTIQPDKIILTLSSDELSENDIPSDLLNDADISINWIKQNVKSWKKYLPIKDYPNDCVILCDDDFFLS